MNQDLEQAGFSARELAREIVRKLNLEQVLTEALAAARFDDYLRGYREAALLYGVVPSTREQLGNQKAFINCRGFSSKVEQTACANIQAEPATVVEKT